MTQARGTGSSSREAAEREQSRPVPDEAPPEPQPEHDEPQLADPSPGDLSRTDYLAILKRAVRESLDDHITNLAAALAYYAFLAIPAVLMVALGSFSLLADAETIRTVIDKLGTVMPSQATELIQSSLTRMSQNSGSGFTV